MQRELADIWKENMIEDLKSGNFELYNSWRVSIRFERRIWWWRWWDNESDRTKEGRVGKQDNEGVCLKIQKSSEKKQI